MGQKIKQIIRRHAPVFLLLICLVAAGLVFYVGQTNPGSRSAVMPSKVVVAQAIAVDQGVQIQWLESQPGSHPIREYIIERSRGESEFKRIARVEGIFSEYVDAEGKVGDVYRVIAADSRGNDGRSPTSEHVTAAPVRPGDAVILAAIGKNVLGASTAIEQARTPEAKAEVLKNLIDQAFIAFDAALSNKNNASARGHLYVLQEYQRQALSLWPQLAPDKRAVLAQTCTDQQAVFETNLYILPEEDQMDGMLVLASCEAMQEGAV